MRNEVAWPRKTREMHSHHFDSTAWNGFRFRDDDIVIATYAKSGTTWMQQIVAQLIFDGAEGLAVAEMSPWVDLRVPAAEEKLAGLEAQGHRREPVRRGIMASNRGMREPCRRALPGRS